jgi:hypothetical protein
MCLSHSAQGDSPIFAGFAAKIGTVPVNGYRKTDGQQRGRDARVGPFALCSSADLLPGLGGGLSDSWNQPFLASVRGISLTMAMRGGPRFGVMRCGRRTSVSGGAPVARSPSWGPPASFQHCRKSFLRMDLSSPPKGQFLELSQCMSIWVKWFSQIVCWQQLGVAQFLSNTCLKVAKMSS